MKITPHLKKELWKRLIHEGDSKASLFPAKGLTNYKTPMPTPIGQHYRYLTQIDFLNEIEPSAHEINADYLSLRPIKELVDTGLKDVNGTPIKEWKITGYDNLETVRYGLQRRFAFSKASHFAGNGYWMSNEDKNKKELFEKLSSWKDSAGLNIAWMEIVLSCFQTGDAAIYMYQDGNEIEYKVFSFLYGDILYPEYDENRNFVLYREYLLNGKRAVDIYANTYVETWVQLDPEEEQNKSWAEKISGWFRNGIDWKTSKISEDGWRRIAHSESQIKGNINQVTYFRIPDIPSGVAQKDIEALERSSSYIAEEVKSTAMPELFIKATKVKSMPKRGSNGKVLGVMGDTEQIKVSDAKFLNPPDASNIAEIDLKAKKDSIMHSTMSVFIEPDILTSGSDSSTTIGIMFYPEVQFCQTIFPHFYKGLKQMTTVLKALADKIDGFLGYSSLKTSVGYNVWLPTNKAEQVDNTTKLVYAGIISQQNARNELDLQYVDDERLIAKEAEDKLYRETYIPLKAKADATTDFGVEDTAEDVIVSETDTDNPEEPKKPEGAKVNNQAARKDIAD